MMASGRGCVKREQLVSASKAIDTRSTAIVRGAGKSGPLYQQLALAIETVTRALAQSVPPPRHAPYFLLDGTSGYDLGVLDRFLGHGIFRKYEFALDLGSGLGGRARWLAARSGCRVLGVDARPAATAAAAALNRRARMDGQVMFCAGALTSLPLRERIFTHAWLPDTTLEPDTGRVLAGALRVLRRGGHFALQCLLRSQAQGLEMLMREAGFVEIERNEVALGDLSHTLQLARERLRQDLRNQPGLITAWEQLVVPAPEPTAVQILARRPA